jgi:isocitrate dehydrogenase (NAD+)
MTTTVVCIPGDGIGPEVTAAMKRVVAATGAKIDWLDMPAGQHGIRETGEPLPQITIDAIARHRLAIKGPTNTPQGKGFSSVNVKLRQHFDLYVGLRPFTALPIPGVKREVDVMLFRENTEGLYACAERFYDGPSGTQEDQVELTARFTRKAMTRLAEQAFSYAVRAGRKRVTVVTKSNIHKRWGRLYIDAFRAVAAKYPGIEATELLVDATAMLVAQDSPKLDVLVTENMFGDILSDALAGRIGGLGVAPGANIGMGCAIFEAVHGSADDIAGKDLANPTALILSAAMLLDHMGESRHAHHIRKAVHETVKSGAFVTGDLRSYYPAGAPACGTSAFAAAVCMEIEDLSVRATLA